MIKYKMMKQLKTPGVIKCSLVMKLIKKIKLM